MNPILNKMGANANEQKKLLMECVSMLEKYVNRFPAEKGCASFSGEDMKLWKEVYFPKLVQTDILLDGKFFCGTSSGNSGIGTDADRTYARKIKRHLQNYRHERSVSRDDNN